MKKALKGLLAVLVMVMSVLILTVSGEYEECSAASKLGAPTITGKTATVNTVTIKWSEVKGADGYRIYKYDSSAKKYKAYATVTSSAPLFYEISGLKKGTTYKFKVAAYVKKNGKKVIQTKSKAVKVKTLSSTKTNASDFYVYDEKGGTHNFSEYVGKPVIINIWATWCGPCIRELPTFDKFYEEYGDRVKFFMINCEDKDSLSYVKEFVEYYEYCFPVYFDFDNKAYGIYGNGYIPVTVAIKADGTVVYCDAGSLGEEDLQYLIDSILE